MHLEKEERKKCVLQLGEVEGPRTVRAREMLDHDVGEGEGEGEGVGVGGQG